VPDRARDERPKVHGRNRVSANDTQAPTQLPQFFDAPQIPVNTSPCTVVTADFNGDGKTDLAVATCDSQGNILLGNGDGNFQVLEGFLGDSIAVGDFNNDGKPDLVISDSSAIGSSSITIHLGNGDGTFQAPLTYTLSAQTSQVIVGDFNGDGKADLGVANFSTYTGAGAANGNVTVFLGNGDGTFQSPRVFPAGTSPIWMATGDFNGDGKADLAVVDNVYWSNGYVDVLLGNGDGTFQEFVPYSLGTDHARTVAIASIRKNGTADLVVTCDDVTVRVLLGNGDGTFQSSQAYGTYAGTCCGPAIIADFNGDGNLDIAFADANAFLAGVLLGNGDGTFGTQLVSGTGNFPYAVAAADFNGDGKLDLATADWWGPTVTILFGNGDGTFQARNDYPLPGSLAATALADFNHDGNLDLAVVTPCGTTSDCSAGTISILPGNGDATFGSPETFASGAGASSIAVGDFNKDGKLDLVTGNYLVSEYPYEGSNSLGISVLLGNEDGTFQTHVDFAGGQTDNRGYSEGASIAVADLNADGKLDIVATGPGLGAMVWLGHGDGSFQPGVSYTNTGGGSSALVLGDFNGDGKPDLAVSNGVQYTDYTHDGMPYTVCEGTTVSVLLGRSDGTFGPPTSFDAYADPETVAVGDFNGDGNLDLVAVSPVCNGTGGTDHLSILLGNGDGTFQKHKDLVGGETGYAPQPIAVSVGDFNLDGRMDIVVGSSIYLDGMTRLFLGNGDGTFQAPVEYGTGGNPVSISVGNLNKDGKPDVVTANPFSGTVSVLRNIQGPDFSVQAAAISPITRGQSASSTVTLASILGYSNPVALSCAVSLTSGTGTAPTCSLSPATVQLAAKSTATSTLAINTSASVAAFNDTPFGPNGRKRDALWLSISGMAFAMVWTTRIRKNKLAVLFAGTLLAALMVLSACGGSSGGGTSGGGGGGGGGNPPDATYSVTVTATSGSLVRMTTLSLTVQ